MPVGEDGTYPVGVGLLCWILDEDVPRGEALIDLALSYNIRAIWLSFGNDVNRWINYVRSKDPVLRNETKEPIRIFYLTSDVDDAVRSVHEWGVDVLVVQGNEAGGHGSDSSPGLLTLLPEIISAFRSKSQSPEVARLKNLIILGAGGLATGDQIASILVGGAAGVVVGTRFLLSPEAGYTQEQKARLVAARGDDSVRTVAYDIARGTTGWPAGVDGRALTSEIVELYENGADAATLREKTKTVSLVWAGSGVGLMTEIKPAGVSLLAVSTTPKLMFIDRRSSKSYTKVLGRLSRRLRAFLGNWSDPLDMDVTLFLSVVVDDDDDVLNACVRTDGNVQADSIMSFLALVGWTVECLDVRCETAPQYWS